MHEGPDLELCGKEKSIEFFGVKMEEFRKNYICIKDKRDVTLYANHLQDETRNLMYWITTCDKERRPTCKSRKEIADFLRRTTFNIMSL